jgi:diguanylate cyclase (GGDEF)-like protein
MAIEHAIYETRATGTIDERDTLTGVLGRYMLLNNFEALRDRKLFIALCDIDNFRLVNDAYGENLGNEMLRRIGGTIVHIFGDENTFRYGSDEFVIVDFSESEQTFLDKLNRLDREVAGISYDGKPLHLTCSYGYVYGVLESSEDLHEAIRFADRKMYEAKRLGKARPVGVALKGDPALSATHAHSHMFKSYEMDELTGLANLMYFRNELDQRLAAGPKPDESPLALVYFNVQNFKGYNERYGFDVGDELLLLIADAIESAFPNQLAARFSSDQFMVISRKDQVVDGIVKEHCRLVLLR